MLNRREKAELENEFQGFINGKNYLDVSMYRIRSYVNKGVDLNMLNNDGNTITHVLLNCMQELLTELLNYSSPYKTEDERTPIWVDIRECATKIRELSELFASRHPVQLMLLKDREVLINIVHLISKCIEQYSDERSQRVLSHKLEIITSFANNSIINISPSTEVGKPVIALSNFSVSTNSENDESPRDRMIRFLYQDPDQTGIPAFDLVDKYGDITLTTKKSFSST